MRKHKNNAVINMVDKKYGKILKSLAKQELKRFNAIPLEYDDLYNCFLFEVPKIIEKLSGDEAKKRNTLFLYAKRFYFNKCRHYISKKWVILNRANHYTEKISDSMTIDSLDITTFSYKERVMYHALITSKFPAPVVAKRLDITPNTARGYLKVFKLKLKKLLT